MLSSSGSVIFRRSSAEIAALFSTDAGAASAAPTAANAAAASHALHQRCPGPRVISGSSDLEMTLQEHAAAFNRAAALVPLPRRRVGRSAVVARFPARARAAPV